MLLDTHALYWLVSGDEALSEEALLAIGKSQETGTLLVSPISAWELSIATQKPRAATRPHLGDEPPGRWFRKAVRAASARVITIQQSIACEAAEVASTTGHKDPGDCFLIATARARRVPLVTRDAFILAMASDSPDYLTAIGC